MPPRTIDNLGVDIYTRYAQDEESLDKSYLTESKQVMPQAFIDVSKPSYSSQYRTLMGLTLLNPSWADFEFPSGFLEQKNFTFTSQLIPFTGSPEKMEDQVERIKDRPKKKKKTEEYETWEEEKEQKEEEREMETLLTLFTCITALDRDIIEINSKRKQFQKG